MTDFDTQSLDLPERGAAPTADWWYRRPALVYFFAAGHPPNAVKIGVTTVFNEGVLQESDWKECIHRRHVQIQSCNHETIELLGFIRFSDGERPARRAELCERDLRKQFKALQRFKAHTCGAEWFTPGAELLDYIQVHTEKPERLNVRSIIGLPINR